MPSLTKLNTTVTCRLPVELYDSPLNAIRFFLIRIAYRSITTSTYSHYSGSWRPVICVNLAANKHQFIDKKTHLLCREIFFPEVTIMRLDWAKFHLLFDGLVLISIIEIKCNYRMAACVSCDPRSCSKEIALFDVRAPSRSCLGIIHPYKVI